MSASLQVQAPSERAGLVSLADVRAMLGEQSDRMERQHREAIAMMVERVDSAEIRAENAEARAERVEQRLDRVLDVLLSERKPSGEPWWRRWFGHSKLGGAE